MTRNRKPTAPFKIGANVSPRHYIPGFPIGASVDGRYVVRELRIDLARARIERDDGRDGSWWTDFASLREWGSL